MAKRRTFPDVEWYAVRHVVQNADAFEERVTLWRAANAEEAIASAGREAADYAALWEGEARVLSLFQTYRMSEAPSDGAEAFSLIRRSDLSPDDYLSRFFDTGRELQAATRPTR